MRVLKGAFIGLLLLLICTPVFAAEVVKLGFFDMQIIIDRSELGKDGAQKFEAEKEQVRQELATMLRQLQELDDEFTKKEHIWSQDVKKTKAQEFLVKQREYKRFEMEANRKLRQQELQLIRPIKDKVFEIINRIGKEEGYTMIWEMRETGLTYAPPSLELTDRVIRELNEIAAKEASGKQ
jgi:outer membrane protein